MNLRNVVVECHRASYADSRGRPIVLDVIKAVTLGLAGRRGTGDSLATINHRRTPRYVPLIGAARPEELEEYGNAYAVLAICQCGHATEVPVDRKVVVAQGDITLERLKGRFRCGKCAGRMPRVEVYRRPT